MDTPPDDENKTPEPPNAPPPPPPPIGDVPRVALGADGAPTLAPQPEARSIWKRIPTKFIVLGAIIAVIAIIGWVSGRGKTNADDLQVGDCFQIQPAGTFTDVTDQPCDGLHQTEVYAEITLPASATWPGLDIVVDASGAAEACTTAFDVAANEGRVVEANIVADGQFKTISGDSSVWSGGDHDVLCLAESSIGFPGQVVIPK